MKRKSYYSAPREKRVLINEQIRVSPVRLIDADGSQVGIISTQEAKTIAESRELDLVLISPTADPPVCRVMDFGKYRYELAKREKSSKKQASTQIKGIRLSPKISDHDFNFKVEAARKFLSQGHKVKVTVLFRGRLIAHKEFGVRIIEKFAEALEEIAKLESAPKMEGARNMVIILTKK